MLTIRTGSRLHFGLFSLHDTPRQFGGVGLMIEEPGVQLCAAPAQEWSADGPLGVRVLEFAHRFSQSLANHPVSCLLTPQRFFVGHAAAEHSGLGTGTQLGLATAQLLAEACGLGESTPALARRVGRGLRSALGLHGFERGGFLVEAGKRSPNELSPLVVHADFPDTWRIVVVIPPLGPGRHGVSELKAFAQLAGHRAAESRIDLLCRLTLLGMLPALKEGDLQGFGEALYEFNARVGDMFAPVQGGVYRDAEVGKIVSFLRGEGVAGVGQSSWGPAVFAVVGDAEQAEALAAKVRHRYPNIPETGVLVTKAMNRGAAVSQT